MSAEVHAPRTIVAPDAPVQVVLESNVEHEEVLREVDHRKRVLRLHCDVVDAISCMDRHPQIQEEWSCGDWRTYRHEAHYVLGEMQQLKGKEDE